jgi:hypothetical protein
VTEPPPARITGYFAKAAPVCIIGRRGPSKWTQFIRWRTDTDEFEPGQWIKGKIDYLTLTSDGRYAAVGIMVEPQQHSIICKPPYFTALEVWILDLCVHAIGFTEDDHIICDPADESIVHATNTCPFERVSNVIGNRVVRFNYDHDYVIKGGQIGYDQQERRVQFSEGKIYALDSEEPRLLYDTNPNRFEPVEAPSWATEW